MAINAYTGLMGSGKSYEVVASVIVPAIKAGRDVVTNIRGLNQELIYQYLDRLNGPLTDGKSYGKIRLVKNDEIQSPDFFPEFFDEKFVVTEKTIVQPGDIVCIDEAWRPWGTDSKCIKAHMSFFREHRQCVDQQGNSCDLVIITQDITDIHKLLKNVIELSFLFTKLKTLGLSKRYRVEVFEGSKLYKSKRTSWTTQSYNKKIFPLYKSYANDSGQGAEKIIDSRQNFLKSGAFLIPLVIAVVLIVSGALALKHFFSPERFAKTKPEDDSLVVATAAAVPASPGQLPAAQAQTLPPSSGPAVSLLGSVTIGAQTWLVVSHPEGLRLASPLVLDSVGIAAVTNDQNKALPAYLNP